LLHQGPQIRSTDAPHSAAARPAPRSIIHKVIEVVEWWAWAGAVAFIVALLTVDLMVFHRHAHEVGAREAAIWTVVWVTLGVGFAGLVSVTLGSGAAAEYLTGYVLEKSLSIDNIVVFALLFGYFAVPAAYQHRVLFWGVVGALLLRAMFIFAGAALLDAFHGAIYLFGAFLVLTGVRMARHDEREIHPERNPLLGLLRRLMPTTAGYRGQRFFVREGSSYSRRTRLPCSACAPSTSYWQE
jgi:tellurite resistance protein TerC